jgi:glycosyltransferase involved in cell wall biosynthesis
VEVLPIELDGGKFEPRPRNDALRQQWGVHDKIVIISTRPLKEMYDHPTLLAALAKPGMEKFAVALVGEGNLRADLEKRATDLKVADRVKFIGMVDNEKIPDHLAAGDMYVTCSRSDSASLGLLEAMASGLPVVASDIPANREWIADGQSGWVFPGGNSEALSKVLLKAAESEQNRQEVALRGRAIALARADARKNFPRLLARIETLAKAPRPQPH